MKILSAFKFVPEDQDIVVKSDRTLDASKAAVKVSPFDLNAIEAACEIKAMTGDAEITAVTVGGALLSNPKARKDVLSRGPDKLLLIQDAAFEGIRPNEAAQVLAAAAKARGFDLIVCGNGSADIYAQQTGLLLGAYLGVPAINAVSKIVSAADGKLVVERATETEVETLELTLPAVICVSADINEPKIPAMRAILAAAKKPVEVIDAAAAAAPASRVVEVKSVLAQAQKARKQVVIEGDDDASIEQFVQEIRKAIAA